MRGTAHVPKFLRNMLDAEDMKPSHCVVCGRTSPLNHHHPMHNSQGPVVTLCGMGNASGCHGKAHGVGGRLFLDWDGKHWVWCEPDEAMILVEAREKCRWHKCR